MKLISSSFKEGEDIPIKYSCQSENINPPLAWSGVPNETKSFALIVDDPDAPVGLWKHWLIKDIPKNVRSIQENSTIGKEITNSFGKKNYGGPCPPNGKHRYFFKLYALDVDSLPAENMNDLYWQVEEHKIDEAILMGYYIKH
jgi:Raf kinase inhibitor-like YbhB/YbcL family protein